MYSWRFSNAIFTTPIEGESLMVIQANMSPRAIVDVWENTAVVFTKYNIPLVNQSLEKLVNNDLLILLLQELNSIVGSSTATCIEGG